MADNALKTLFTDIATAIRERLPDEPGMSPLNFPAKIREVASAGGGGSSDLVKYVTFMSYDGTTEYGKKPTISGDDCLDPIEIGLFDTPTKDGDYIFAGWTPTFGGAAFVNALLQIIEDRTLYAAFTGVVLKETQISTSYSSTNSAYSATVTGLEHLVTGQTYTVEWDGVPYTCLCQTIQGKLGSSGYPISYALGNPYNRKTISGTTYTPSCEDTGEPFFIFGSSTTSIFTLYVYTQTSGNHTLKIY